MLQPTAQTMQQFTVSLFKVSHSKNIQPGHKFLQFFFNLQTKTCHHCVLRQQSVLTLALHVDPLDQDLSLCEYSYSAGQRLWVTTDISQLSVEAKGLVDGVREECVIVHQSRHVRMKFVYDQLDQPLCELQLWNDKVL